MDRSAAPLALQVGASEEGHVRAVTLDKGPLPIGAGLSHTDTARDDAEPGCHFLGIDAEGQQAASGARYQVQSEKLPRR